MSYEITYDSNTSVNTQEKIIAVNNSTLYKVCVEKRASRVNEKTEVKYTLKVSSADSQESTKLELPHEVMLRLSELIENSLDF